MELSNQIAETISRLKRDVDDYSRRVIEETGKEIERGARRNFKNVINDIPADDPTIFVYSFPAIKKNDSWSKSIICNGNQVLFVEFGAGETHKTETTTVVMDNNQQIEYASRPNGIVGIGEWGSHRGRDDVWFYKSKNGRESLHSHFAKYNRYNEFIMITSGIRPVRALYRAIGTAFRKLGSGRLAKLK